MPRVRRLVTAVGLTLLAVSCGSGESSDGTVDSVRAAPTRVPDADIRILDLATGTSRRLLDSRQLEGAPAWSPDGRRIAFGRLESGDEPTGDADIWIADVSTGELEHVLAGPQRDTTPAWSPDGVRLAFTSDRSGNDDIWIVDLERGTLTQLTNDPGNEALPAFSPDGHQVAYVTDRNGRPELGVVDAGGGESSLLTVPHGDEATLPAWSPDGGSIAFVRQPPAQFPELWIAPLDGSARRIDDIIWPGRPAWAPDGKTIAVSDEADGHLYTVDTRTGATSRLTIDDRDDFLPTWSPDGTQIAYGSVPNPTTSG